MKVILMILICFRMMSITCMLIMIIFNPVLTQGMNYQLNKADGDVLQEFKGEYQLYTETWSTIPTIDLSPIEEGNKKLLNFLEIISDKCSVNNNCKQNSFISLLKTQLDRIISKSSYLSILNRKRRGLVNFVGTGLKILFGTLSEGDAEKFNNEINEAYIDQNFMHRLLSNQSVIVKSALE